MGESHRSDRLTRSPTGTTDRSRQGSRAARSSRMNEVLPPNATNDISAGEKRPRCASGRGHTPARRGDTGTMAVERQHTVSQVLLKQWADEAEVLAIGLAHGDCRSKSPRAEGFTRFFVQPDFSTELKRIWSQVEGDVPRALGLVRSGRLFEDESAQQTLKDLFAIHFVRARHTEHIWGQSLLAQAKEGHLAEIFRMVNEPEFLAAIYETYTGLLPVGPTNSNMHARNSCPSFGVSSARAARRSSSNY